MRHDVRARAPAGSLPLATRPAPGGPVLDATPRVTAGRRGPCQVLSSRSGRRMQPDHRGRPACGAGGRSVAAVARMSAATSVGRRKPNGKSGLVLGHAVRLSGRRDGAAARRRRRRSRPEEWHRRCRGYSQRRGGTSEAAAALAEQHHAERGAVRARARRGTGRAPAARGRARAGCRRWRRGARRSPARWPAGAAPAR